MARTEDFWRIVERPREAHHDIDVRIDAIGFALVRLPYGELVDFQLSLGDAHGLLNTMRVLGAASALLGFVSDDVFSDIRSWVILQGREATEAVASDPDSLADLWLDDQEELGSAERFSFLPTITYEERFLLPLEVRHPESDFAVLLGEPRGSDALLTKKALRLAYPKCASARSRRLPLLARWLFR